MHIRSFAGHVVGITFQALIVAAIIAALAFGAVLVSGSPAGGSDVLAARGGKAGGGGKGGAGNYTATVSPAGPYVFGQDIWVTTNAPVYPNNTGPWIDVSCVQNGTKVYGVTHAGFEAGWYYNWAFTLGPTYMWTGGAADCKVWVYHQSNNSLVTDATATFHVDG